MDTFEELLRAAIRNAGLTPSSFGVKIGYKHGYQGFHDLIAGRLKRTPERMRAVTQILGVAGDYFDRPDLDEQRQAYVRRVFAEFLATDLGQDLQKTDPETLQILEKMPFPGERLPRKELYAALALALQGRYATQRLIEAERENVELNNTEVPKMPKRNRGKSPKK